MGGVESLCRVYMVLAAFDLVWGRGGGRSEGGESIGEPSSYSTSHSTFTGNGATFACLVASIRNRVA